MLRVQRSHLTLQTMKRIIPAAIEPLHLQKTAHENQAHILDFCLIALCRLLSLFFFARGLWHASLLLRFDTMALLNTPTQTLMVFFTITTLQAIFCLLSATGLWLLSSWGVVLWLAVVVFDAALYAANISPSDFFTLFLIFNAATVSVYLILSAIMTHIKSLLRKEKPL
jgi:hypothetical protein